MIDLEPTATPQEALPTEVKVLHGWPDADRLLLALRITEARISEISAKYDQQIQEAQEAKAQALSPLIARRDRMEAVLEPFVHGHQDDFPKKRRSLTLVHGVVGFRKGQRVVRYIHGEAHTERLLRVRGHDDCIELRTVLVKDRIRKLPPSELAVIGVAVDQEERYFYDLAEDPPIPYPKPAESAEVPDEP